MRVSWLLLNDKAIISRTAAPFSRLADNRRRKTDNKKICILSE
ncbi:hypothetical protein [Serratia entomophila]|jgi:hypothetical protein|nr:hypothetical protein [Serratia entomophila]